MMYKPMLLTKADVLPEGPGWGYEAKLDGYRMMGELSAEGPRFVSRQGNNFTDHYPVAAEQVMAALSGNRAVVDGEMVGIDENGQHDFRVLSRYRPRVVYYIFDLLELNGEPLIGQPLVDRKRLLDDIFVRQPAVEKIQIFTERDTFVAAAQELRLEGVVAKKLSSTYRPGKRTKHWQKLILNPHNRRWN